MNDLTKINKYCYDLTTLKNNLGPYTAAYCAGAFSNIVLSFTVVTALISIVLA